MQRVQPAPKGCQQGFIIPLDKITLLKVPPVIFAGSGLASDSWDFFFFPRENRGFRGADMEYLVTQGLLARGFGDKCQAGVCGHKTAPGPAADARG